MIRFIVPLLTLFAEALCQHRKQVQGAYNFFLHVQLDKMIPYATVQLGWPYEIQAPFYKLHSDKGTLISNGILELGESGLYAFQAGTLPAGSYFIEVIDGGCR
jgi:hypothetical protein